MQNVSNKVTALVKIMFLSKSDNHGCGGFITLGIHYISPRYYYYIFTSFHPYFTRGNILNVDPCSVFT